MRRLMFMTTALLAFSPAQAQTGPAPTTVLPSTPEALREVLSAEGYRPEVQTSTDQKESSLKFKVSGETLYLTFKGCAADGCQMVSLDNGFERPKDGSKVAAMLSAWNATWYTQAYEDKEGYVYLSSSYVLTGGYTKANVLAWLGVYLEDYEKFSHELYR